MEVSRGKHVFEFAVGANDKTIVIFVRHFFQGF